MTKVLVTRRLPDAVEAHLAERYDTTLNPEALPLSQAELHQAFQDYDVVLPAITDRIGADLFQGPRRVKLIANYGVGVNHIDAEAARAAGVLVSNTPDVLTDATAELAITLMLAAALLSCAACARHDDASRQAATNAADDASLPTPQTGGGDTLTGMTDKPGPNPPGARPDADAPVLPADAPPAIDGAMPPPGTQQPLADGGSAPVNPETGALPGAPGAVARSRISVAAGMASPHRTVREWRHRARLGIGPRMLIRLSHTALYVVSVMARS